MYQNELALNNLQLLIYYKTKTNQTKSTIILTTQQNETVPLILLINNSLYISI